ncbi:DUF4959 domain-containing protein [Sunxiuqinia sp. sy24]|uniref:DUF4959 domain-containing protein n=1 Tax=Sunxiuqinia sp. sy24 TaxID=3461495 RepID=UPI0040460EA5
MKRIKNKILQIAAVATCLMSIISCEEAPIGQMPVDKIPPGMVSNPMVENINGGAKITYELPLDQDLLSVKAIYTLNGGIKENSSSVYKNHVVVAGFGDTEERVIKLICVDRSGNESEPVSVSIKPLTPPIELVGETFEIQEDFGGIRVNWENEFNLDIAVTVLIRDTFGIWVPDPYGTFYSNLSHNSESVRGYSSDEREFAVYARDRWGNYSDTIAGVFTPWYEEEISKENFRALYLVDDKPVDKYGWVMPRLWDGVISGNNGIHGYYEYGLPIPFTFDLGGITKLSRFTLYPRNGTEWAWTEGAALNFEIWGAEEFVDDGNYGEGSGWTKLTTVQFEKPSGLPYGEVSNEDLEVWSSTGLQADFPLDAPPSRYLRIVVLDSHPVWSEIFIYGEPRE